MSNTYYKKGDWSAVCDRCGFEFKSSQLKKTWDGLWVCHNDFEIRHPQDFIRGIPDKQTVPWVRPEANDGVVEITFATPLVLECTSGAITSTDINSVVSYTKSFIIGSITSNLSISAPTNALANEKITIVLVQDSIGNYTVTWDAIFTGVTLAASGTHDQSATIIFKYDGANWDQLGSPSWT